MMLVEVEAVLDQSMDECVWLFEKDERKQHVYRLPLHLSIEPCTHRLIRKSSTTSVWKVAVQSVGGIYSPQYVSDPLPQNNVEQFLLSSI